MKQRKIDIEKVIREIEKKKKRHHDCIKSDVLSHYQEGKQDACDEIIQIIKDNIKESEEINIDYSCHWNKKYNDLLRKYLNLSDKYFNLRDRLDNKLVYKYET